MKIIETFQFLWKSFFSQVKPKNRVFLAVFACFWLFLAIFGPSGHSKLGQKGLQVGVTFSLMSKLKRKVYIKSFGPV
jgi:hypothetical protein